MCPDKKRPAENTCRIVKGLDAVWAHFCPSKPCLPLPTDGTFAKHVWRERGGYPFDPAPRLRWESMAAQRADSASAAPAA